MSVTTRCPKCGHTGEAAPIEEEDTGMGCFLLWFGGLVPWLVYRDHLRQRVQCAACGYVFHAPPRPRAPLTPAGRTLMTAAVALGAGSLLLGILFLLPAVVEIIPDPGLSSSLRAFFLRHAGLMTWLVLLGMLGAVALGTVASGLRTRGAARERKGKGTPNEQQKASQFPD